MQQPEKTESPAEREHRIAYLVDAALLAVAGARVRTHVVTLHIVLHIHRACIRYSDSEQARAKKLNIQWSVSCSIMPASGSIFGT